jgi:hypothetical protein
MIRYVLTSFFIGAMAFAIAVWIGVHYYAKYSHRDRTKRVMKSEFLRVPANNTFTVIGLLLPILAALSAYLYTTKPAGDYTRLVTVIAVLLAALMIAIWETFALLKKATTGDEITLEIPGDLRFITGLGILYAYLLMALILLVWFFLFDLPGSSVPTRNLAGTAQYYIGKPGLRIGDSAGQIEKVWGAPVERRPAQRLLRYDAPESIIELTFDGQGTLERIVQTRR